MASITAACKVRSGNATGRLSAVEGRRHPLGGYIVWVGDLSRGLWPCLAALVLASVPLTAAHGQYGRYTPAIPDQQIFYSHIQPLTDTSARAQGDPRPPTAEGAIPIGGWLLYGNLALGSAYDSNFNGSSQAPISVNGIRLVPSLIVLKETGVHRTEVYGAGDIRYYPSEDFTSFYNTRAGATHSWRIQRDFIYRVQGQFGVNEDTSSLTRLDGITAAAEPVTYSEEFGSTSLEKGFGRFIVALGGSVGNRNYDNIIDTSGNFIDESFRDGERYIATGRLGYHISPFTYVFVEPSHEWLQYSDSNFDSDGDRLAAGIGTGRIRLMNGEIYVGQFSQDFEDPTVGTIEGPFYGGRLSWFPTRFITVTGHLDHYFDLSDYRSSPSSIGAITENSMVSFDATWDITRKISLETGAGFTNEEYIDTAREDDITFYSVGATYYLWERLGINVKYTYRDRDSNVPGGGYTRDFFSAGGKTRF